VSVRPIGRQLSLRAPDTGVTFAAMTAIGFYHLTRTGVEQALPALLGRTLAAGERAVVLCGAARLEALDVALWRVAEPIWLPHGTARTGDAALQPIWITDHEEAPNGARFLFLLDGHRSTTPDRYERIFDLFDGADPEAVAGARLRWTDAKNQGLVPTYWKQDEKGWSRGG